MSDNNESDSTNCSVIESTNKRSLKNKRKSESAILDDILTKIKEHVNSKRLLMNPFEVIKYKQQISSMKLNSYKLKFTAEKIKSYLNGLYKQSKSIDEILLLNNRDPLWDCGITQDLLMLNSNKNDLNPIVLPAQTENQSLSFDADMLSNQLFISEFSQNSVTSCLSKPSNATHVNLYDDSQNCELNIVSRKSHQNSDVIKGNVSCTETLQKDHKCVSEQSFVNNANPEKSIIINDTVSKNVRIEEINNIELLPTNCNNIQESIILNNTISENVRIEAINSIGLHPTNCSSAQFKSYMLSNQNFLPVYTKSPQQKSSIDNTNNASKDLFTQEEINFDATENESKTNNSTEPIEFNWPSTPTKAYSNKRSFNIVKKPIFKCLYQPSRGINSSSTEAMSIDETETMSLEESLNIITSVNSSVSNMDIDSTLSLDTSEYYIKETDNSTDEIIFKKPFIIKRKPTVSSSTQVPSSSGNSPVKKRDKTDIDNLRPIVNECEELCNLTKKFLNIVEATNDDSKKVIEVLENISNPSCNEEFQTVSEIGSENWEDAAEKLDETNYLHQEISDWLQDILDNMSSEDKTKSKEAFSSLENEVANCLDPKDMSDLDIKSLFHSNYKRLEELSKEFNRQLILDDFKSTTKPEECSTDLSYFDWKKLL